MARTQVSTRLFGKRSHCAPITVGPRDRKSGSRIAGAPPVLFAKKRPACAACKAKLDYLATYEADVVGELVANGKALSVFHCPNMDCMFTAISWVNPSNLVCIAHEPANRAPGKAGRALVVGTPKKEQLRDPERSTIEASKLGGWPALIQTTAIEMAEQAASEGFGFLFQFDDGGNSAWTTSVGFLGGIVYFYGPLGADGLPHLDGARGFFSNS